MDHRGRTRLAIAANPVAIIDHLGRLVPQREGGIALSGRPIYVVLPVGASKQLALDRHLACRRPKRARHLRLCSAISPEREGPEGIGV